MICLIHLSVCLFVHVCLYEYLQNTTRSDEMHAEALREQERKERIMNGLAFNL